MKDLASTVDFAVFISGTEPDLQFRGNYFTKAARMDFYTVILRQSAAYWVALCLENGIVGQGDTRESAIATLKDAIESVQAVRNSNPDLYNAAISIRELHEFLTLETKEPASETYELRAVHA